MKKRAGKRRTFRKDKGGARQRQVTEDNWEQLLDEHGQTRKRPSLTELLEHLAPDQAELSDDDAEREGSGIVISVASARCRVFRDGEELDCMVPAELAVRQKSMLAVGDRVRVSDESGIWKVEAVLPRRTVLARPDPLHAHMQRIIAANVDVVVHVVSLKAPALRPRLIDRYLIAIQRGGAQPVICVNKVDLLSPE
ncbi:MAG: GTPase RsgA, partial [Thermoanaerobaculia bacterium]